MKRISVALLTVVALAFIGCKTYAPSQGGYCWFDGTFLEIQSDITSGNPYVHPPPDTKTTHYWVDHYQCSSMWHHDFYYTNSAPIGVSVYRHK